MKSTLILSSCRHCQGPVQTNLGWGEDAILALEGSEGSLGRLLEGLVPELFAQPRWSLASTQERLDDMRRELDDVSGCVSQWVCACVHISVRIY